MTDPVSTAATTIGDLGAALAARTPTPGGGAAAAVTAALGCAAGAMALRYTTGPKWATVSAEAEALAERLDAWRLACLADADADATAYAQVGVARKAGDTAALAAAEAASAAVPERLLARCAEAATALRAFLPKTNPNLVSDVWVGLHLLAGGGRAAHRTLVVNRPPAAVLTTAEGHLAALMAAEA
jgi:formiminotetrahydrofolate cyclodeaminase